MVRRAPRRVKKSVVYTQVRAARYRRAPVLSTIEPAGCENFRKDASLSLLEVPRFLESSASVFLSPKRRAKKGPLCVFPLYSLAPTGFILDRLQLQADLLSGAKQRVGRLPGHVRAPDFVRRWPVTRPRNAESCARARADLATYGGGFGSTSLRLIERRVRALPGARARRIGAAPSGGFAQALRRRWFAGKRLWVRAPRGRGARGRRFYDVYG